MRRRVGLVGRAAVVVALTAGSAAAGTSTPGIPVHQGAAGSAGVASAGRDEAARAVEAARRTGSPVEIVGERTETARVFANPSGTRTLEQHVLPVRARRDGRWLPIDVALARGADGSVSPGATAVGLRLSGGGAGPLVTLSRDGAELSLSWPGPLPTPELTADTARYPEVLPGVDLRVRVNAVGFSQLLVVKDAAAARNPALRRIRFGTATTNLTLRAGADGGTSAVDAAGRPVFTSGPLLMWDSASAAPGAGQAGAAAAQEPVEPRRRAMTAQVEPDALVVVPDQAMLSSPDTVFPVYIDPSYSAAQYRWTVVSASKPGTSYWTDDYYREDFRVGKTYGTGDGPWRTLFQFNVARVARATVSRAWVSISMTHTATCAGSSVELWHTRPIDPATALTWNNSAGHWLRGSALATRSGKANKSACGQPPALLEFGIDPDTVTPIVQEAVRGTAGPQEAVAFGLRIPASHENNSDYWKRFNPSTARLSVEYNTPPREPTAVSTVPPTPCGTAAAPTALATTTPTFSGVGYDPNTDNVANELEVLSGDTVLARLDSGTVGSGTSVRWSPVPADTLPTDQPAAVFNYRARTRDAGPAGPYSQRCYFTVDTGRPTPPRVTSVDFPGTTAVKAVGEAGVVTFAPGGAEADIAGYRYGFSQDAATMWVGARPDGGATIPVTLWPANSTEVGDVRRTLYVRAVDRAGNASTFGEAWSLAARARAVTAPAVRADVNGDRRADITAVMDHGDGRTAVWNLLSGPGGFHPGYIGWDTGVAGGFPADLIRSAPGDFDADGRTDVAVLREDPDHVVRLFMLRSDGNRYLAAGSPVWAGTGFRLSHLKVVAGDFDGDGDDDLAEFQGLADGQVRLWLHVSDGGHFGAPVMQWDSGTGGPGLSGANVVVGDFDGDGDDDLADVHEAGAARARLMLHLSDGGRLGPPSQRWDSGAGAFDARRARFAAGNVDGVAGDEVVALYDDGGAAARLVTIGDRNGAWTAATWWSSGAGGFDATRATLAAGDFDADGRADVAGVYDTGGGTRRLYTFASTGAAFASPRTAWEGYVSAATPTIRVEPARRYRIHAALTGKCLDVPGGSTANNVVLDQWDCVTTATWEQFRLERVGASPYFQIRTAADKCVDAKSWSLLDNVPMVQWPCGGSGTSQANQQFRLEYLGGTGLNLVVAIRTVHSDKCLGVEGASLANGAAIVQVPCAAAAPPNQQFLLRVEP